MTHCLEACCSLLSWQNTEPFLHHIVTCDEMWILFNNSKCSARLLDKDKIPKHTPKLEFHQKKLMVLVWWFSAGVIHYSFMKPGMAITADVCINQLHEMMRKLALKQLRLVNKDQPMLLQDNAQPHVAQGTLLKIQQWNLEVLSHPLYSPDLAPTDYHFFQALDNFLFFIFFIFFIYLFSFLLTINLKLIKVHIEIKIVNKEAATKRSTLLHAQCQLCMVAVPLNKAM